MAENQINNEDLFSPDLFKKTQKDLKDFIEQLNKLDESFINIGKSASESLGKLDLSKTKDIEKLNTLLRENSEAIKALDKQQLEKIKNEKQLNDLLKKINKLEQDAIKLKSESNKKTKETNKLTDEEIKAKIRLQEENKKKNKQIRESIELEDALGREIKGTNDLIELGLNISKRELKTKSELNEANKLLRKITSQLNIEIEEEAKIIKQLNDQIDANSQKVSDNSDKVSKAKQNVGNYKESIKEALEETGLFGEEFNKLKKGLTLFISVFGKAEKAQEENTKAVKENTEASKKARKEQNALSDSIDNTSESTEKSTSKFESLNKVLKGSVIGLIVTALGSLTSAFTEGGDGAESFGKVMAYISGTVQAVIGTLAGLGRVIISVGKDFKNLTKGDFSFSNSSKSIDEFNKLLAETPKRIQDTIKAQQEQARVTNENTKEVNQLTIALAKLTGQEQLYIDLVDDDTLNIETRNKLKDISRKKTDELFQAQIKQAKLQKDITEAEVRSSLSAKVNIDELTAKYGSLANAIKDGKISGLLAPELLERYSNDLANVVTQEFEYVQKRRDNSEKIRKLEIDSFELILDNLQDFTDKQITLQEKVFNSTSANLDVRKKALLEIQKLTEESFDTQLKYFNRQRELEIKASIEALKLAGAPQVEIQKQQDKLNEKIEKEVLLRAKNSEEFNEYLRNLGISEKLEIRSLQATRDKLDQNQIILDTLEEQKNIVSETNELQKEIATQEVFLNQQKIESLELKIAEAKTLEEIEAIEKELAQAKEKASQSELDYQEELRKAKIEALREEIRIRQESGEVDSIDLLNAQKELNDLLLEEQKSANDKINEENEKALKERQAQIEKDIEAKKKLVEETSQFLNDLAEAFDSASEANSQKRLDRINRELDASVKNQDRLRAELLKGNAEANKSLADEENKQVELEKKKLEEEKRRAREQFVVAGVQAYANSLKSGKEPPQAIAETITSQKVLTEILKSLSPFYHGTDDTGDGSNSVLSDKYGKITGYTHENEMVLSAKEKKEIGDKSRKEVVNAVKFYDNFKDVTPAVAKIDTSKLESKLDRIHKALENVKAPELDYDQLSDIVSYKVKKGQNSVVKKGVIKNSWM